MNRKSVIFVHGIGPQKQGYSDDLWSKLWFNEVPPEIKKYEVYYYDVFQELNEKIEIDKFTQKYGVENILKGLIKKQAVFDAVNDILKDTVSHVLYFLLMKDAFNVIINIFIKQLNIALTEGYDAGFPSQKHDIIIISHSLGTVVAYCGLFQAMIEQGTSIQDDVRIKSLFTLATPLELIKVVSQKINVKIPHISVVIDKPKTRNSVTGMDIDYVTKWYSYRNKYDPVASLIPLKGSFLDNPDELPYVFGQLPGKDVHDYSNYLAQARTVLIGQIEEDV